MLRWVGVRNAQCQNAVLHLLAKLVEFLELAVVASYEGRGEPDAALRHAGKPAHRREGAPISNGGDHALIQNRSIGEAVHAIRKMRPDPNRDVIAPADDNIGSKRCHQVIVGLRGIGDHRQPSAFASWMT